MAEQGGSAVDCEEICRVKKRLRFVQEVETGERSFAELCRIYQWSRTTGYKWWSRYEAEGPVALGSQSREPHHKPHAVSDETIRLILALRAEKPYWGERKLQAYLKGKNPDRKWPAASTIGELLKSRGLTYARKKRRRATPSSELRAAKESNEVWAIDFKGNFQTGDGARCDPLTISDTASRYLLRCQAVARTNYEHVRPLLEATMREYGLPLAIRSDNGSPFASTAVGGLSRLSIWLIRLGVWPERIAPGHPEQNGIHERMHRTLKQATARPPRANLRAQQKAFDAFLTEFNEERPHEALAMETPASVYVRSTRRFPDRLPEVEYPALFEVRAVEKHGDVVFRNRRMFLTEILAGERVGFEEADAGWRIWFGPHELAWLDRKQMEKPRLRTASSRSRQRVEAKFLKRASGRPTGSLQRASKTENEEVLETEAETDKN